MSPEPSERLVRALDACQGDHVVYDLDGVASQYATLLDELPGVEVRFAVKACPVRPVLELLARHGAGFDAASPAEITDALATGAPVDRVHYGNTVKSDTDIADAYRLGVRTFATDSLQDVAAIAEHAPGSRVFCRLTTTGAGALWGLSRKFGCSAEDAVRVLAAARRSGLTPAGLSVHVGSQQMTADAWRDACETIAETVALLQADGIHIDHVNLGGGLPARGYLDRAGRELDPPVDKVFAVIRDGMDRLRAVSTRPLAFVVEPGRHLVADHGAVRAHVYRLTTRHQADGRPAHWLFLSCGKFNGLYEMDQLRYRLRFPGHSLSDTVPAVIAGPTCDSDDAYASEGTPTRVPAGVASGDPVWILSAGAYATSYATRGFNGFRPLPVLVTGGTVGGPSAPVPVPEEKHR